MFRSLIDGFREAAQIGNYAFAVLIGFLFGVQVGAAFMGVVYGVALYLGGK